MVEGLQIERQRLASGKDCQFKHHEKSGRVTVAGKPSDDLPPGTLNSIFKQAGWKKGMN